MKKYFKRKIRVGTFLLLSVIPVLLLGGCGQRTMCEKSVDTAMGTVISQTIYVEEGKQGVSGGDSNISDSVSNGKITDVLLQKLNALEQEKLSWRIESSEVAQINASASKEATPISAEMTDLLRKCLQLSADTQGAFDVSIGQLSRLWDIDTWAAAESTEDYQMPEQEQIQQVLQTVGWQRITLEQSADGGVRITIPQGMQLDLGAVGKGVAMDEIRRELQAHPEVSGAVISVGGGILTYGKKPEGTAWQVAVTDPQDPSQSVGVLTLDGDYCVSTSGDYERYVEVDGVRYHHILDPRTGAPARSDVAGVTIVTKDGFYSDALSTACFVLGQEEGMQLLENYEAEGLFIDHEGNITMTDGMKEYFHLSNSGK